MRLPPARGRAALMWITVAFLATTWASETQGFPEARHAQSDALANTPLMQAALYGDLSCLRFLLDRGDETVTR